MNQIWWRQVTNASRFLHAIAESMLSGKSLILMLPEHVPWYQTMTDLVETEIKKNNSVNSFDYLEAPSQSAGSYMLEHYCRAETRAQYRPSKSYGEFLAGCDDLVLNDKYIWVRLHSKEQFEVWAQFVSDYAKYAKKGSSHAAFILEIQDGKVGSKPLKGVSVLSFNDRISYYDKFMFNLLAAADVKESEPVKQYLAELTSVIGSNDIELCAKCIDRGRRFLEQPIDVLQEILATEYRSDGDSFDYEVKESAIQKCIWETQIKMVFPRIEAFRSYFVEKYQSAIRMELPIATTYGERYEEASDVELGTLHYMAAAKKITIQEKDYTKLVKFKEARNTLAHLKILSQTEFDELYKEF